MNVLGNGYINIGEFYTLGVDEENNPANVCVLSDEQRKAIKGAYEMQDVKPCVGYVNGYTDGGDTDPNAKGWTFLRISYLPNPNRYTITGLIWSQAGGSDMVQKAENAFIE